MHFLGNYEVHPDYNLGNLIIYIQALKYVTWKVI